MNKKQSKISKIKNAIGANSFSQIATIIIQLLSVPLFLSTWGIDKYGTWITISAIPTYLQLADAGFVSVAMNRMVIESQRGDWNSARETYIAARLLLRNIFIALTIGVAIILSVALKIKALESDNAITFAILAMAAMASIYFGLYEAALRTCDRNATGVMLQTGARLAEFAGSVGGLFISGEFLGVAAGGLAGRLTITILTENLSKRYCKSLISVATKTKYSAKIIRELVGPALHFLVFPVSNALNIQGFTLVCSGIFGPTVVAQFSAIRTLSRVVVQMGTVLGRSFWPEFSSAYGTNNRAKFQRVLRAAMMANAGIASVFIFLVNIFGSKILQVWTHGAINPDATLLFLLTCSAAIHVIFMPLQTALLATNMHEKLAKWTILSTILAVLLAYYFSEVFGIVALPITLVGMEIIIGITAYFKISELKNTMEIV